MLWNFHAMECDFNHMAWDVYAMQCYGVCCIRYAWTGCR